MVDNCGNWTYEPDTPENKKCDCDLIADWIVAQGYKIKTNIENLVDMIILCFDCVDNYGEHDPDTGCGGYGEEFTIEECIRYVEERGISEFDYYA